MDIGCNIPSGTHENRSRIADLSHTRRPALWFTLRQAPVKVRAKKVCGHSVHLGAVRQHFFVPSQRQTPQQPDFHLYRSHSTYNAGLEQFGEARP